MYNLLAFDISFCIAISRAIKGTQQGEITTLLLGTCVIFRFANPCSETDHKINAWNYNQVIIESPFLLWKIRNSYKLSIMC